jgi:hypothetical protein
MFGRFFDTKEVEQYADWIVSELKRTLRPDFDLKIKNIAEQAEKMNEKIARRTAEFTKTVDLNIYKKAWLASRVRDGMAANGYPESYVKSFSYDLLARIEAAATQRRRSVP